MISSCKQYHFFSEQVNARFALEQTTILFELHTAFLLLFAVPFCSVFLTIPYILKMERALPMQEHPECQPWKIS